MINFKALGAAVLWILLIVVIAVAAVSGIAYLGQTAMILLIGWKPAFWGMFTLVIFIYMLLALPRITINQ